MADPAEAGHYLGEEFRIRYKDDLGREFYRGQKAGWRLNGVGAPDVQVVVLF